MTAGTWSISGEAIASADVVATATGGKTWLIAGALDRAKAGVFILNVSAHVAEEIDGENTCASILRKR